MKKYFIILNDVKEGPYTLEELLKTDISQSSLVWVAGMDNWLQAKYIQEISSELKKIPPPLPEKYVNVINIKAEIHRKEKVVLSRNNKINIAKEIKLIFIVLLISIGAGLTFCLIIRARDYNSEIADAIRKYEFISLGQIDGKYNDSAIQVYLKTVEEISQVFFKYHKGGMINSNIERDFLEPKKYYGTDESVDIAARLDRIGNNLFNMASELKSINRFYIQDFYERFLYTFIISFIILYFGKKLFKFSKWVSITAKE